MYHAKAIGEGAVSVKNEVFNVCNNLSYINPRTTMGGGIHPDFRYFFNNSETVHFYSVKYLIPEIQPF